MIEPRDTDTEDTADLSVWNPWDLLEPGSQAELEWLKHNSSGQPQQREEGSK